MTSPLHPSCEVAISSQLLSKAKALPGQAPLLEWKLSCSLVMPLLIERLNHMQKHVKGSTLHGRVNTNS